MSGRDLALVFNALRANDLVWPYVVNNYLKGKAPAAFDILYWNADSTNLPGPDVLRWYVRNTYLENNLRVPGKARMLRRGPSICDASPCRPTCSRRARTTSCPGAAAYRTTALFERRHAVRAGRERAHRRRHQSRRRRTAAATGRTARPRAGGRGGMARQRDRAARQLVAATGTHWLAPFAAARRRAPKKPGNTRTETAIEPAPGRYVRERID